MPNFNKIVFVGDAHTGKTHALSRLVSNTGPDTYSPTMGATATPYGAASIWDTGGAPENMGFRDGYFVNAAAFVIFGFARDWLKDVSRVCPEAKIHIYKNKQQLKAFIAEFA